MVDDRLLLYRVSQKKLTPFIFKQDALLSIKSLGQWVNFDNLSRSCRPVYIEITGQLSYPVL